MNDKFQRKPEYVEAFQMTEEVQNNESMPGCPTWAKECRQQDQRIIGAMFSTDPNNSLAGLTLRTSYGKFPVPIGSWIVRNNSSLMIVADDHFKAAFEPISKIANTPAATTEASAAKKVNQSAAKS